MNNSPELISLLLRLQPLESPPASRTPAWWGRAAHNLLLKTIQSNDAQLSSLLHDPPEADMPGKPASGVYSGERIQ